MSHTIDVAAMRAQQSVAMEAWAADVSVVASTEQIGTWHPPAELQGCIWFRCGVRQGDGSMPPHCRDSYQRMRRMGAFDAPKNMRPPSGFESDGTYGVYVGFFPETWAQIQIVTGAKHARTFNAGQVFTDKLSGLGPTVDITAAGRKKRG